jgi:hypothetical protein
MNPLLTLGLAVALTASANAQILSEDFSSGVPPTGWTHVNNNAGIGVGWISDGAGRAWHEDEAGVGTTDFTLVSPVFDLTGVSGSTLTFDGETYWAAYLANHPTSYGDGVSNMEISTDGGATWTMVWTDTSQNNGDTYSPTVDLSAFDGMSGVQLGIHFYGTWAQEWWVDNVVIDGGGSSGLTLSATGLVSGGVATISVSGATANGNVLLGYSWVGAGPTQTRFGMLDLSMPIHSLPTQVADASGNVSVTAGVAVRVANHTLYGQAVDMTSGEVSNAIAEPIL